MIEIELSWQYADYFIFYPHTVTSDLQMQTIIKS